MSMKFPGFATLLMCAALVFAQQPAANTKTKLLDITQRLLDAIALGDKSLWAQYLADDVVFTGDDGRTVHKHQFLEELRLLPKGYSGSILVEIRDRLAGVDLVWKRTVASATNVGAMYHAHGSFDVKITPQPPDNDVSKAANLGRMTIDKQFHGDLEGTSKGEMLSAMSADVKNSGVYVAIERVTGTVAGRQGSFVLHHTGIMDRGQQHLTITVAPDSGTDGLKGITGTMNITITPEGKHFYDFDYQVAAAKK
jgi:hypothetical protein